MDKKMDYQTRFPVDYAGPGGHPTSLKSTPSYPYSTPSEISYEEKYYTTNPHSMTGQFGRPRLDGRRAGVSECPLDKRGNGAPKFEAQELYDKERNVVECIANGVDEKGQRKIWNVRDAKEAFVNYKFVDGEGKRHALARFVMHTTEGDIKDWKTDEEKKADAEKEKEEKKRKEDDSKKKGDGPNSRECQSYDTKEGEKSGAKSTETSEGEKEDKQKSDDKNKFKANNKDEQNNDKENEKDSENKPKDKQEEEFIAHIIEEQKHLTGLKNNDGKSPAPMPPDNLEMYIAEDDQFIPDNWIPRSSSIIRLTGKSPLNAEAPLSELFGAGLITPTRLHYVRNHGEVPKLNWETHMLNIFSEPKDILPCARDFTMDDIASMEAICIPVTIACDGNRRKEVNLIKDTDGVPVRPVVFIGRGFRVPLRDLLIACGAPESPPPGKRWYVHYEGADNCSSGPYGTSIPFMYAMDPTNDVMLAYEMNGRVLHPDHGYPLRSIIPGFVGGRAVKWLKRLWVSEEESKNWYHIWDNRVLPSFVTEQDSLLAKVFYHHPSTACYEQILNSVICKPAHGEEILCDIKNYRVAGYAYTGGGTEITNIEISLDGGKTWRYCFRRFPDAPLRHGRRFWTWLHWYCDVKIEDMMQAREIKCRAWDVAKNAQPDNITWNISGMMNNSIFCVKSQVVKIEETGAFCIRWEHPTVPGSDEGWMKPSPEEQAKLDAEAKAAEMGDGDKQFTIEEVAKHGSKDDCWIVINSRVYDVTSVLDWHPGGANAILPHAGKCHTETTLQYASIHDDYANKKRDECYIGVLTKKGIELMKEDAQRAQKSRTEESNARKGYALQKYSWCPVTLVKRTELSHDTRRYTFALPKGKDGKSKLGLPIGNHVVIGVHFRDQMVTRPYTPTRPILASEDDGTFDLVVKTYFPDEQGKFPPGGTLGNYLDCVEEGEQVDAKGPMGEIVYLGKGCFTVDGKEFKFTKLNLLAGGSGITPHYQLIHAIVEDESDNTKIRLVNCNNSEEDMLLFDELNDLEKRSKGQCEMWHVLSHPKDEEKWKKTGGSGHFDEKVMKEKMFEPSKDCAAFVCGPPGLVEKAGKPNLEKWGFKDAETLFGW